jgi:hypothetical protein
MKLDSVKFPQSVLRLMIKKPENHMLSSVLNKPNKLTNYTKFYLKKIKTQFSIILVEKPLKKPEEVKLMNVISMLKISNLILLQNSLKNLLQDLVK